MGGGGGSTRGCGLNTAAGGFSLRLFATAATHTIPQVMDNIVLLSSIVSRGMLKNGRIFFLGVYTFMCNTTSKIQWRGYIFGMFHFLSIRKTVQKVCGAEPTTSKHSLCYLAFPNSRTTIRGLRRIHYSIRGGFRSSLYRRSLILDTDPLLATQATPASTNTRLRRSYSYLHPDAGLDRHPEHLPRDQLLELLRQH